MYRKPEPPINHCERNIQPNSRRAAKLAIWERRKAEKRRRRQIKRIAFVYGLRSSHVCVDETIRL